MLSEPVVDSPVGDSLSPRAWCEGLLDAIRARPVAGADVAYLEGLLTRLHDMGVRLSVDDFGTGYSSLSYLKRLPVDEVKIDRGFVTDMRRNADDAMIVRSIIDLGANLSLSVVAEGVEDDDTWRALADFGCEYAQGYHLSRPLPLDRFESWLDGYEAARGRRDADDADIADVVDITGRRVTSG